MTAYPFLKLSFSLNEYCDIIKKGLDRTGIDVQWLYKIHNWLLKSVQYYKVEIFYMYHEWRTI